MARMFSFTLLLSIVLSACTNNETRKGNGAGGEGIFFDYKIRGEERDSEVTLYIQYRMGGPNGSTLLLGDPAKVQLDGELMPVDSAKVTGAYYELRKPADSFTGKHTIVFTDIDEKQYPEEFEFRPFSLKADIPPVVQRDTLTFDLAGVDTLDFVRVTATDTSFASRDIIEIDTIRGGRLIIPVEKLKNLVNGPIILLLSRETERSIRHSAHDRGRIVISYGLQREFMLEDKAPK